MGTWPVTQTMSIMAAMLHVVYECDVTKVPRGSSGTSGLYERGPQGLSRFQWPGMVLYDATFRRHGAL